jgi:hypothetical protein
MLFIVFLFVEPGERCSKRFVVKNPKFSGKITLPVSLKNGMRF